MPCQQSNLAECLACEDKLALWCRDCNNETQCGSGLCLACYTKEVGCQYCHRIVAECAPSWLTCKDAECSRRAFVCELCVESHHNGHYRCKQCWRDQGAKCIVCSKEDAQNERQYKSRCKACLAGSDASARAVFVQQESLAHINREIQWQTWNGTEPGLQLLVLPLIDDKVLRAYSNRPDYLAPDHCQLCDWSSQRDNASMPHNSVTEPAPEHHSASDTVNGTENAHDHLGPPASSSPRALEPALHIPTEKITLLM